MSLKNLKKSILLTSLLLSVSFCNAIGQIADETALTIDLSKQFQTIENFGASDAWACQFVGNWPQAKKNAIVDLLFSSGLTDDGSPAGIGLSLWRVNIGAGSIQQGSESGIRDEWRRAESFMGEDRKYNWDLQAGQMWFMQAAKDRGVNQFLGFCNSPPVHLTHNGKAFATASKPNLSAEKFDAFAEFLSDVVSGVKQKTGFTFNYLSPVNEPQWDWSDGGQEGSPFFNNDISGIVKSLDAALLKKELPVKIMLPEAAQYEFLYSHHERPGKGQQINAFFNSSSPNYIGNLKTVDRVIAAHSYFTTSPDSTAVSIRKMVADSVSSIKNLRLWQSEYCILGDNAGEIKGEKRDLGIESGLYLAKVIHNDLVYGNATAWQWWTAVSSYDYKDGLVYVDKNKTDGEFYASKMLWALGNYSRFIRPGAIRVEATISHLSAEKNILASSYINRNSGELITVFINNGNLPQKVKINVNGAVMAEQISYVTSANQDLAADSSPIVKGEINLQPESVVTLVSRVK